MKLLSRMLLLFLLASSSLLSSTAQGHTLVLEFAGNKVAYAIDGVDTPLGKLLDSATDMFGKEPQSQMVIIFDSTIALDVVLNAQGIFNKAGFQKVTLFARWKKSGKMCEVFLGTPVPFTLNPQ